MKRLINWLDARFPLFSIWKAYASEYYVPKNLNFFYFFGSLALFVLLLQLITSSNKVIHLFIETLRINILIQVLLL